MLDQISHLKGLRTAALLGILIGIAVVTWVAPDTTGGIGILIVVPIVVMSLLFEMARGVFSLAKYVRARRTNGTDTSTARRD